VNKKLLLLSSLTTLLCATNGDLMIATDTKSMGMGGVGIATSFGATASINNPALLSYSKTKEFAFNVTALFPTIKTKTEMILDKEYQESDSSFYLIPSMAYMQPIDDRINIAVGMWGVAGMGVDFSDAPNGSGLFGMQTDLMIMHIATPVSYRWDDFSLGIAPILQVGILNIEYQTITHHHPYDKEYDINLGAKLGGVYDWHNGLKIGVIYQTPISMTYESSEGVSPDLKLEQPQEYGIGLSYRLGHHLVAFDYKRIDWDDADGYKEFGWKAQNVYALGYAYEWDRYTLRAGYNYAKAPVDTSDAQAFQNYLNLLGFPATSKSHYTFGASYEYSRDCMIDMAFVYSPNQTTSGKILDTMFGDMNIYNKHKEISATIQLNYKF
jgi:long-chain fatty acid transport protein